ncbi:MAG TPA: branched-chain amino acid ABC transporter permease [Phycisphaerales bacterium]|nr:branched-chain amino acid ABC transporter permease [Phycisphaerales bacterium]
MADFLQTLITAITVGSLYALIALGYTMVYGILKFINFAHSDIFVLGAWSSYTAATFLMSRFGMDPGHVPPIWFGGLVLLIAMIVCGTVGFTIERLAYKPLRRAPRLNVLITAIGVSLLLQNVGQLQFKIADDLRLPFGTRPQRMPSLLPDTALNDSTIARGTLTAGEAKDAVRFDTPITVTEDRGYRLDVTPPPAAGLENLTYRLMAAPGSYAPDQDVTIDANIDAAEINGSSYRLVLEPVVPILLVDVAIVVSAIALMIGLELLVYRTRMGAAMRACSHSTDLASLMGVPVDRVISFTFILGSMLAAAAGFLNSLKYPGLNLPAHEIWVLLGLKAFVAAVVGGIGNVRGAVLGGFLIAFIEFFGMRYIDTNLRDVYVFVVLIIVLLVKPSGLLGSTVREKV